MPLMTDLREQFPSQELSRVREIAKDVSQAGGRVLCVGGCVRDALLKIVPEEFDLEVSGIDPEDLRALLARKHSVDEYGKSFGVLKLKDNPIEVSVPRSETKSATGHRGFSVDVDPHLPFPKAAARRDFTVNAIGLNPLTGESLDPYDGAKDLDARILRHVGPAFVEDPLRVLRGMQFAARFDLTPSQETIELCRTIDLEGLAAERIFDEWKKLLLKGKSISLGLNFLRETTWLRFFPELEALVDCPQDPEWHPEGDVWVHTLHCMNAFAEKRIDDEWENLVVGFSVLCHDFGKPLTTITDKNSRIRSPKHESKGEAPTRSFLQRMTNQKDLPEEVVPLVRRHLAPRLFYNDNASDSAIRRLARQVVRIDRLVRVAQSDMAGRPPKSADCPEGKWLLDRAEELRVKAAAPQAFVLGRHLIERGMKPGAGFSPILEECFEAQLDGVFTDLDGGLAHLDLILKRTSTDV
ncbi:MAG: polynucleotide adenylyltransferase [Opitutae bacterium]|nr:polynucleotide adenylyltransferase [Opitutae bacterium]